MDTLVPFCFLVMGVLSIFVIHNPSTDLEERALTIILGYLTLIVAICGFVFSLFSSNI